MYRARAPYVVEEYHVQSRKHAEHREIDEYEQIEAGVEDVCEAECRRAHAYRHERVVASAESVHHEAAENEFLAHALYQETEQGQQYYAEVHVLADGDVVRAADHRAQRYRGHQHCSDEYAL